MDITQTIKAIIILDADGRRILSKSYDPKTGTKQFERQIFVKTKAHRIKDDILVVDGTLVIHKFVTDLHLYIIGSKNENPIILDSVLNCLFEVLTSLLNNKTVERQSVMDHLSQVILALDEVCDQGLILETDSNLVLQRTTLKDDVAELTMAHKLQLATEQFKFPWIRS